jgi:hypothetical protein
VAKTTVTVIIPLHRRRAATAFGPERTYGHLAG